MQKLLVLIRSHLFILAFVPLACGDRTKNILLRLISKSVCFCLVLWCHFALRFLNHFICICGVVQCLNFILLHVVVQFSQHHVLKMYLFSIVYSWLLCCRLIDHRWVGLYLGCLFHSTDLCICFFVTVPYYFDYRSFELYSEVKESCTSNFVCFFSRLLWLFRVKFIHKLGLFAIVLWKILWVIG